MVYIDLGSGNPSNLCRTKKMKNFLLKMPKISEIGNNFSSGTGQLVRVALGLTVICKHMYDISLVVCKKCYP